MDIVFSFLFLVLALYYLYKYRSGKERDYLSSSYGEEYARKKIRIGTAGGLILLAFSVILFVLFLIKANF